MPIPKKNSRGSLCKPICISSGSATTSAICLYRIERVSIRYQYQTCFQANILL